VDAINSLPTDFDYIYHYGAINGTTNFYKMPNRVLENNFVCDLNVFNFARRQTNLTRLVYASSSEVVADDPVTPVPEHADVFVKDIHNARWSYRLAKITSENFLANSDLPYVMLRYFNVYGENSKQGHFLGDQINKIRNGVFSVIGAQETRSFCHVHDAIRASIYVAEHADRVLVNIGNDREITIGDAVRVIAQELGHPNATFEQLPSLPGSVATRRPDIAKLRSIMPDYKPMSFEQGIRQILS
jgi:UDP-glucose 4-epimerase